MSPVAESLAHPREAYHAAIGLIQSEFVTVKSTLSNLQQPFMSVKKAVAALLLSGSTSVGSAASGNLPSAVPDYTTSEAGNPFIDGWYADPDTGFYNGEYWIFPTWSDVYEKQTHLDAFSSPDLVTWTKHSNIITTEEVSWAHKAMWAPAHIERNGKYYLYFGANDIQIPEIEEGLVGGIGVGVADSPGGPYKDAIGKPLIADFHNGAQPIDQDVFIDDDGQAYIYYGGHSHANVAKLNEDMISLGTFDDGTTFKEITPENFVEGSYMIKRNGVYYFMWSEGGWGSSDYSVSYAMSDNPLGPFERVAKILEQDDAVARSSGHNGIIHVPDTDIYYITYHRRPLSETARDHRVTCYDRMYFNEDGTIQPVKMLVKDNFNDGKMIAWNSSGTTGSGDWQVMDQKLVGSTGDNEGLAIAFLDTNFTDVQFDAKVAFEEGATPALAFRSSNNIGNEDYYWAKLSEENVEIGITQAGEETILASENIPIQSGEWYEVRVLVVGTEIQVFLNDMERSAVGVEDDTLLRGATGVLVRGEASFDDVAVSYP
ncbi:glycosyl hydrolases family 43 domain-containing protein [Sarocladium implicatum]|nr:glycosyl hydrolases family 43 domain-containing protein [Sarocladium implicatum]